MRVIADERVQSRTAGLPASVLRGLRSADFEAWVADVDAAEEALSSALERATDQLFGIIGRLEAGSDRKALVEARRHLHNRRFAQAKVRVDAVSPGIAEEVAALSAPVFAAADEFEAVRARGELVVGEWLRRERLNLGELLDEEDFARGLGVAAPSATTGLLSYRAAARRGGTLSKNQRKAERTLLQYAWRAAAKTSPFSSLTRVGIARCSGAANVPASGGRDFPDRIDVSRASVYPIALALDSLWHNEKAVLGMRVMPGQVIGEEPDGAVIVHRSEYDFSDATGESDQAAVLESLVRIVPGDLCDTVAAALEQGAATVGAVVDRMHGQGVPQATALRAVQELIRLGFLVLPDLRFHPHIGAEAVLESLPREIEKLGDQGFRDAVTGYVEAAESLSKISGLAERSHAVDAIRGAVKRVYEVSGCSDAPVPQSVVYEDSGLGQAPELPSPPLENPDLGKLFALSEVLDESQVPRAMLRGFFLGMFGADGRCENVPAFLDAFKTQLYSSHMARDAANLDRDRIEADPWLRWGEAWRWEKAQGVLRELVADAVPVGGVIDIRDALATSGPALRLLPDVVFPFRHLNIFAQVLGRNGLVVNNVFGGPGFGLSRFAHLFGDDAVSCVRSVEDMALAAGVTLHELLGGAAVTNLNLHGPLLRSELRMPGDPSGSRAERQTSVFDLDLIYISDQGRLALVHRRTGEEVLPTYIGYLVPFATPTSHQLMGLLAPPVMFGSGVWGGPEGSDEAGAVEVKRRPRVAIGDHLVLERATWEVPAELMPSADPTSPNGLVEWCRWWRALGLPETSFIRIRRPSATRRPKPRYHDTGSLLGWASLAHEWRQRGGPLTVAEALPALPVAGESSLGRVQEFIIGLSAVTKGKKEHVN
jgi:hypothetical protein